MTEDRLKASRELLGRELARLRTEVGRTMEDMHAAGFHPNVVRGIEAGTRYLSGYAMEKLVKDCLGVSDQARLDSFEACRAAAWDASCVFGAIRELAWPPKLVEAEPAKPDVPTHYDMAIKPIDAIEAWSLGFRLGNVVKYVSRAGRKDGEPIVKDLEKARWYLNREIEALSKGE